MALQAFVDESFDEKTFVMAGFLAGAETWRRFEEDWKELLPYYSLNKHNEWAFKMVEMAKSSERMERVHAFAKIIERYGDEIIAVSVAFKVEDHKNALDRIWSLNGLIDFGSYKNPYMFALTAMLRALCSDNEEFRRLAGEEKIDFIFDERQKEKEEVIRIWEKTMSCTPAEYKKYCGLTPRFGDDKNYLPLQAADLLAWWVREAFQANSATVEIKGLQFTFGNKRNRYPAYLSIEMDEDHIAKNVMNDATASLPHLIIYDKKFKP